ncbi:restriction endonuclease [Klebsiella pneumoniae]|nr:restriction endonuclease [Klebsiella pneumoniae]
MSNHKKNIDTDWYNFQEEICEHFKNLGANAKTNVTVEGVRGISNIDVVVESKYLGTDFKWFVEAKYWNSNVTKEIVHAFLQCFKIPVPIEVSSFQKKVFNQVQ